MSENGFDLLDRVAREVERREEALKIEGEYSEKRITIVVTDGLHSSYSRLSEEARARIRARLKALIALEFDREQRAHRVQGYV